MILPKQDFSDVNFVATLVFFKRIHQGHQRQSNGGVQRRPYSLRWNTSKRLDMEVGRFDCGETYARTHPATYPETVGPSFLSSYLSCETYPETDLRNIPLRKTSRCGNVILRSNHVQGKWKRQAATYQFHPISRFFPIAWCRLSKIAPVFFVLLCGIKWTEQGVWSGAAANTTCSHLNHFQWWKQFGWPAMVAVDLHGGGPM